jgi:hypothetical protein
MVGLEKGKKGKVEVMGAVLGSVFCQGIGVAEAANAVKGRRRAWLFYIVSMAAQPLQR